MRSLIISIAILLLTTAATLVNMLCVASRLDRLCESVEKDGAATACEKYWEMESFLALSISDSQLSRIEELLIEYENAARGGDIEECELQKERLLSAIAESRRLSGINIRSVA